MTARPLEFGVAFHKAMEVLHDPSTWKFTHTVLGALAEKAFVEECWKQREAYLNARRLYALENEEEEDYDERVRLGRGMLKYYVETKLPDIQANYVPVYVELSFDVPLHGPDGNQLFCKCQRCRKDFAKAGGGKWFGNPVVFSGRLDVLVHDMFGNYWIWDWKTTAQFGDIEEYLELDDQVGSYVMALVKKMGLNIRGFIYFELRKGFPEPPQRNKVVRLGRQFSVSKNQTTDYDTYVATIQEEDTAAYEAGLYDDFLAYLKASGANLYYRWFKIFKSDYQLAEIERELVLEVQDMIDPNVRIYKMPGRFSCKFCAFRLPCLMKDSGQDYEYTLQTMYEKREPYFRLQLDRASTESKGGE